ncbi:hypothetical protein AB1K83_14265 [Sporosarcina sp. 179-K 3D1 HS]|uniref:hypothetical protein n=1 Tax=Sporosarcina sp. 179-K 3D1 HS TaxID=3232169 RepID=UPI0039A14B70
MKVNWRKSAIDSLLELDQWRETIELPKVAPYLKNIIQTYFEEQRLSIHLPGRPVYIQQEQVDLRMVLIALGKSDPYKVFYREGEEAIEIYLIRHPRQKPI